MNGKLVRNVLMALAVVGLSLGTAEAGGIRKPAGVGSNLHRRFVIKRTYKLARKGVRVPRYAGVWNAGGYRATIRSASRK